MLPEWVGVAVLALPLGLVLGYLSALPRVKVLEKELAQQLQLKSQEKELDLIQEQCRCNKACSQEQ
jgi:uncharacterized membrane-anchored protein YhcB (DUF1043 family)